MNLEYSDEQLALRATVRRFLAEKATVAEHVRPLLDDATGVTDAVWQGLAQLGTTGLLIPDEHRGAGMSMVEAGIVLEELGAALYPGPWLSTAVTATRALNRFGAEAAELLAGIADGSTIATVGPLAGPRPAVVENSGGAFLAGEIDAMPDADAADVMLVLAEDSCGIGLFAVNSSLSGVVVTSRPGIDQTTKQSRVLFDDAPAQRLAQASPDAIQALVDDVLVAHAADALGAARAVLEHAVEYAKVRKQFGRPIGAFQAVQHLCAEMYETVELARSGVIHALWAAGVADSQERHLAAVRCKAFAGRLATVGDTAIQIFGGIGYTWEHDAHLYLKRLLSWNEFLGGPDRYLQELGRSLIRSPA
jgi:alkylation response protein AidB-like acyl-CoA dehydrogenase